MADNVSGDVAGARAAKAAAEAADAAWREDFRQPHEVGSPLHIGVRQHQPSNADFRELAEGEGVH